MKKKYSVLLDFCHDFGMEINASKTKFMVINGTSEDRYPLSVGGVQVQNCDSYVYLGATFTQDGKVRSSINRHCKDRQGNLWKFIAFMAKNVDFIWVKRKVFESAFLPAILYSCESWLGRSLWWIRKYVYVCDKSYAWRSSFHSKLSLFIRS